MSTPQKYLIVLTGPTGVGKSDLSLSLAQHYGVGIVSADSRQIYRGMEIGTDAPTPEMLASVPHHLIGTHDVTDYYSASLYERDALSCIAQQHETHDVALLVGGSMMYIDAVTHGIDQIPDVDPEVRQRLWDEYATHGTSPLRERLSLVDPSYLGRIDPNNHKRIIHALEVYETTGHPFSAYHTGQAKPRPFITIKIGLDRPRPELYDRINSRVEQMMARGLLEESRRLLPYAHLNALNTVGYKETFALLRGELTLAECVQQIAKHTRIYARKQLSWYRRDTTLSWFHPSATTEIHAYIASRFTSPRQV